MTTGTKKRYLYEVDLLRIIFIFGVLLNHTTTVFANRMVSGSLGNVFLHVTHLSLHFTRMGFMFITGLVLFLSHYNRPTNYLKFWKKRYLGVGIPYLGWIAIFTALALWVNNKLSYSTFLTDYWRTVLRGDRFYMYYLIVVFQLYLIFPLLVWGFKRLVNYHLYIFIGSIVGQMFMLMVIKYGLPHVDTSHWPYLCRYYGFNVLVYQVYFIAGALTAIHYDQVVHFIEAHYRLLAWSTLLTACGTVFLYLYDRRILGLDLNQTESIHQPYIFLYDMIIIPFIFWVGLQYSKYRTTRLPKWFTGFISTGSKISFGIYLSQSAALGLLNIFVYHISTVHSTLLLCILPLGYMVVLALSYLASYFCYKVPPFGVLIGRPQIKLHH